jgi:hypothetical protein
MRNVEADLVQLGGPLQQRRSADRRAPTVARQLCVEQQLSAVRSTRAGLLLVDVVAPLHRAHRDFLANVVVMQPTEHVVQQPSRSAPSLTVELVDTRGSSAPRQDGQPAGKYRRPLGTEAGSFSCRDAAGLDHPRDDQLDALAA